MTGPAFKAGGLGNLTEPGFGVWVCEQGHACASGTSDFFCFVFDEVNKVFVPWGPDAQLRLLGQSDDAAAANERRRATSMGSPPTGPPTGHGGRSSVGSLDDGSVTSVRARARRETDEARNLDGMAPRGPAVEVVSLGRTLPSGVSEGALRAPREDTEVERINKGLAMLKQAEEMEGKLGAQMSTSQVRMIESMRAKAGEMMGLKV